MKLMLRAILPCLAVLIPRFAGAQDALKGMSLGFAECSPALFLPITAGFMVRISEISYARTGMLESFKAEVSLEAAAPVALTVTVDLAKWTGRCSSLEYTVVAGGHILTSPNYASFRPTTLDHAVGFSATGTGVVVAGGPLETDLITNVDYDHKGRRYVRRQTFGVGGRSYEILFAEYTYLGPPTGRLASYSARVSVLPQ